MNDWFEKIEAYLDGGMSAEERARFETQVAENEELASLLEQYREIASVIRNKEKYKDERANLKKSLEKIQSEFIGSTSHQQSDIQQTTAKVHIYQTHQTGANGDQTLTNGQGKQNTILWKRLALVASILAIVCLGILWYVSVQNNRKPAIIANNKKDNGSRDTASQNATNNGGDITQDKPGPIKPLIGNDSTRSGKQKLLLLYRQHFIADAAPDEKTGPLQDAYAYYENKEYKNAIRAIEDAETSRGEVDEKQTMFYKSYYKGQSYMAVNNISKAITELNKALMLSPDHVYKAKAQWHLALALIKSGNVERAQQLLNELSLTGQTRYKSKAQKLLIDLNDQL